MDLSLLLFRSPISPSLVCVMTLFSHGPSYELRTSTHSKGSVAQDRPSLSVGVYYSLVVNLSFFWSSMSRYLRFSSALKFFTTYDNSIVHVNADL